jgi:pimeloyl-ACP methyl ester carboxylesterase
MTDATLRSRYVMAGGVRTHYTEAGDNGPVVVALHGGGAGASGEAGMAPIMRLLATQLRVIAPDSVGGYGRTDPSAPSLYGLQSRVDHLEAVVDTLCLEKFCVVGNSMGAWVAAKYAISHPDRVRSLVMIASNSLAQSMGIDVPMTSARKRIFEFDGTREGMRKTLEGLVFDRSMITEELLDLRMAAVNRPGALESYKASLDAHRRMLSDPLLGLSYDMRHTLPALTRHLPSVMLWGANDESALPEVGRALEVALPDVQFHWLDRAGHQLQTDHPAKVADVIREYATAKDRSAR